MSVWSGELCPSRGVGLSHIKITFPRIVMRCSFCKAELHDTPPEGVPETASRARTEYATIFDHAYNFTISGKCLRSGCGYPKDQHADFIVSVDGSCMVDHRSVEPWTVCPICHDYVEPKFRRKPEVETAMLTVKEQEALNKIALGIERGYYQS